MNKEKPILFNDDMVRAILSGEKTQSRRMVAGVMNDNGIQLKKRTKTKSGITTHVLDAPKHGLCPYGNVGDRLWVREAFQCGLCTKTSFAYRATHKPEDLEDGWWEPIKWKPSIHMPRLASRITLKVTAVRVERLNDITEADCWAEGILEIDGQFSNQEIVDMAARLHLSIEDARVQYALLWESIYGAGSWGKNPWVWVIEFKRME
ncbi:hypothetical protein [Plesiomonas shigelloides]|uniref:hypothetical protein n=1 Tax=Plesiomonas shigelloides TaxID=703 RepID=UPI000A101CF4|nr:hypothetical protein [Plesiomonas shigelloides]